jgi:hypothetical protein
VSAEDTDFGKNIEITQKIPWLVFFTLFSTGCDIHSNSVNVKGCRKEGRKERL